MKHDVVSPAVCASHSPGYQDVADVTAPCDDEVDQVPVFGLGMHSCCFMDLWLFEECIRNGQLLFRHKVSRRVRGSFPFPCHGVPALMAMRCSCSRHGH